MQMQKISSQDAAALLKQAGAAIRALVKERDEVNAKFAAQKLDTRVVKLAREMEAKGLGPELSLPEKVAHLRKAKNLEVTEEAVKLAAPQGQVLGDVSEVPGAGEHPFVTFIQTGEDLR